MISDFWAAERERERARGRRSGDADEPPKRHWTMVLDRRGVRALFYESISCRFRPVFFLLWCLLRLCTPVVIARLRPDRIVKAHFMAVLYCMHWHDWPRAPGMCVRSEQPFEMRVRGGSVE